MMGQQNRDQGPQLFYEPSLMTWRRGRFLGREPTCKCHERVPIWTSRARWDLGFAIATLPWTWESWCTAPVSGNRPR